MKCEEVERVVFTMTRQGIEEGDESKGPLDTDRQEEDGQSDVGKESGDDGGGVRLPSNMEPPGATTTTIKPKAEKDRIRLRGIGACRKLRSGRW